MQLSHLAVVLCIGAASAAVIKTRGVPELKCGPLPPHSEHTPYEPDANDHESMCKACKIRACNADLPMPEGKGKGCRCQYSKVGDTITTDCKPPFADGVESVGDWKNCPHGVRDCKALEGQCVSATFKMDSAPKPPKAPEVKAPKAEVPEAKVPEVPKDVPKADVPEAKVPKAEIPDAKVPKAEVPEAKVPKADVPEAEVPEVPKEVPKADVPEAEVPEAELKCGPVPPYSEHEPFEPDVNDHESMCQACKIRACNANLPMPGDGGKACRCQYSVVGDTYTTDCKPPFADGVESVGDWQNCPGGVRDCKKLEGQCVSATFKMDSAAEPPKLPQSGAAVKSMMALAALTLFYLA